MPDETPQNMYIKRIELRDILDVEAFQSLMDDFYSITGFGIAVIDIKGDVLISTDWQEICSGFHRVKRASLKNCIKSDIFLTQDVKRGQYKEYKCNNNLIDVSTPIFVSNQHVGNLFLGQFLYENEEPDYDVFLDQAKKYGFDTDAYMKALAATPRYNREKVKLVMSFFTKFAEIISTLLTSNLALTKALEENSQVNRN